MNYWWMNTDPHTWNILKQLSPGQIERWDARDASQRYKDHMKDVRPRDIGLCYQTGTFGGIVAVLTAVSPLITDKDGNEVVEFQLTEFLNKVAWDTISKSQIISTPHLKIMRRNTLFSITKDIYDRLLRLSHHSAPTSSSVIAVNISWNPYGWLQPYVDRRAGHSYARNYPGHESVNFHFNKTGIDTTKHVFGYCQWKNYPTSFEDGGYVVFYTRNLDNSNTYVVGIYGDVELLKPPKKFHYDKFEHNTLLCNMKATKSLSLLFPLPLDTAEYSSGRMAGQIGFKYYDEELVRRVVLDEYDLLQKGGHFPGESLTVLNNIYFRLTGKNLSSREDAFAAQRDRDQQEELLQIQSKIDLSRIREELRGLKASDPEQIEIKGKTYRRDNKTIAQLKLMRGFKCQICSRSIEMRDGCLYVEAAHITPKSRIGPELPENILILCPNHHKEFDLGRNEILERTHILLRIRLNGKSYSIDLSI